MGISRERASEEVCAGVDPEGNRRRKQMGKRSRAPGDT